MEVVRLGVGVEEDEVEPMGATGVLVLILDVMAEVEGFGGA